MAKYNIGDKVKITNGYWKDEVGVITEIISEEDEDFPAEYKVKINARGKKWPLTFDDNHLEKVDDNLFEEFLNKCQNESDDPFFEMAGRIPGDVKIPGKEKEPGLIIAVGANENRGVSHFHIFRNKIDWKAWKNGACLMFTDNKYFDHANNTETLTEDELNAVIECLKSEPADDLPGDTNWQYLIYLWNANNYNFKLDIKTPIVDYNYKNIMRYKEKHK